MKRVLILLLFAVFTSGVIAQSKTEQKVAAAVERLKQAMISGNRADLENIASADLNYGHSSGKVEDKASFVETIASGKSDFVSINLTDQTIKVTGKTAIVRHKLAAQTNDGGKPGNVNIGVLLVFHKMGGDWKLLGRQAYRLQ
jgi:hypothetical protein